MSVWKRFGSDQRGTALLTFGLTILPVLGLAGAAVDYGRCIAARTSLQVAADAAVVVLANDPRVRSDAELQRTAEPVVRASYAPRYNSGAPSITVSQSTSEIRVDASAVVPAMFARFVGRDTVTVGTRSTANKQSGAKLRLRILVDNSASMGLAADADGRDKLHALTGCAFACHDKEGGQAISNLEMANLHHIETRVGVLRDAITDLINKLDRERGVNDEVTVSVHSFDDVIRNPVPLTSVLSNVTQYVNGIQLGNNTSFSNAMPAFADLFGMQGDGHATPKEYALIVTDGVQGRRDRVGGFHPFDASLCAALKGGKGTSVMVLHTVYIPMPDEQPYRETVQPIEGQIAPALQKCASSGLYFPGTDKADILKQFDRILGLLKQVRITS